MTSPTSPLHSSRTSYPPPFSSPPRRSRRSPRPWWPVGCLVIALAAVPATAFAGKPADAKAHIAKATKAHKDGKFDEARVELEAAYALDPQPDLLYALGQVHAKLGNCGEATSYFKRFIGTQTDPQVVRVVDQAIAACKPAPAPVPEPPVSRPPVPEDVSAADRIPEMAPPAASPPPAAPPPTTTQPPAPSPPPQDRARARRPSPFSDTKEVAVVRQPSPWYKDKLGDALVLGGVVATVVGLVEYRGALSDLDAAEDQASTTTLARYHELVDNAHGKRATSIVLVGAGAALVTAGIVRYVLRGDATEVHTVGIAPAHGGGVVTYQGGF